MFAICTFLIGVAGVSGKAAAGTPNCGALATNPAFGLAGNPAIKTVAAAIIPAGPGVTKSYCQVNILFGTNANQNINIRVGLPLNATDGGAGGLVGAWNGRTEGLGGGGCTGNLSVTAATNAGYVGSGTDGGHSGAANSCEPAVNADGTYNVQFIQDWIRNAVKEEILLSKSIAANYYGMKPKFNYWNGCSTGGHQGMALAQELGEELDGVLASAPAMYWTRFQTAQMWGQIAWKQKTGNFIAASDVPLLEQAKASAIAACDAADGVADGIIDDPRTCKFDAKANICGTPTAPVANCLTPQQAEAMNLIWDGPRNKNSAKIWFGLDKGTDSFGFGLDAPNPFPLGVVQFHWDEHNLNFDWKTVDLAGYPQVAQDGDRNLLVQNQTLSDVTDTFGDLDTFKRKGGKMITVVGGNDQLIYPRGVINYYRTQAAHFSRFGDKPDYENLQKFYRLFRAPGAGHCGPGAGPFATDPFGALVSWVETGVAPPSLAASGGSAAPSTGRTRILCPYPQTAIYKGTGSTDDAANFQCGGNLEIPKVVCKDVLVKYKHEFDGHKDFKESGLAGVCNNDDHDQDRDERARNDHDHDKDHG
jgi:feruloyl esterase